MTAQPATFPGLPEPDFIRSEHVESVAHDVLAQHGKDGGIARLWDVAKAIRDEEVRVIWLLNIKPFDPTSDDDGHDVAGKCVKAPRLWSDVTGVDAAIWIRAYHWDRSDEQIREAMLLHEILHLEVKRDPEGRAKLAVRKHDLEDFVDVVRHYGPVVGDAKAYLRAAALFTDPPDPAKRPRAVRQLPLEDDEDLRPTGEVNPELLRRVAEEHSEGETTS